MTVCALRYRSSMSSLSFLYSKQTYLEILEGLFRRDSVWRFDETQSKKFRCFLYSARLLTPKILTYIFLLTPTSSSPIATLAQEQEFPEPSIRRQQAEVLKVDDSPSFLQTLALLTSALFRSSWYRRLRGRSPKHLFASTLVNTFFSSILLSSVKPSWLF